MGTRLAHRNRLRGWVAALIVRSPQQWFDRRMDLRSPYAPARDGPESSWYLHGEL